MSFFFLPFLPLFLFSNCGGDTCLFFVPESDLSPRPVRIKLGLDLPRHDSVEFSERKTSLSFVESCAPPLSITGLLSGCPFFGHIFSFLFFLFGRERSPFPFSSRESSSLFFFLERCEFPLPSSWKHELAKRLIPPRPPHETDDGPVLFFPFSNSLFFLSMKKADARVFLPLLPNNALTFPFRRCRARSPVFEGDYSSYLSSFPCPRARAVFPHQAITVPSLPPLTLVMAFLRAI